MKFNAQKTGERSHILTAMLLALGVQFLAHGLTVGKEQTFDKKLALTSINLAGFGVLIVALSLMSDFDLTRELAVAFAWLILIAVLMANGEKAFATLAWFIRKYQPKTGGTDGSTGGKKPPKVETEQMPFITR